ncbi:entericidin, EcnA/B family [Actibacterium mucosum]|nr:entericidin, EcnA/B family [Actibacterium mucosum]
MRVLLGALALLALTGCSTVEGIGEDISAGARTVRDAL